MTVALKQWVSLGALTTVVAFAGGCSSEEPRPFLCSVTLVDRTNGRQPLGSIVENTTSSSDAQDKCVSDRSGSAGPGQSIECSCVESETSSGTGTAPTR